MATETRPEPLSGGRDSSRAGRGERGSLLRRIRNYYREIVSEMRKVIYPTRAELLQYVLVVVIFVAFVVAVVYGLDYGFGRADLAVFG